MSVKLLTPSEAARRSPDAIGLDLAVRLRLSCGDSGFYFYTWGNGVAPVGYSIKFKEGRTVWLNKMPGHTEQGTSPGIDKLNSFVPGVWRLMSGYEHAAIEWEVLDSTSFKGEKHGFTAFIKLHESDTPIEIFSDPYVVPTKHPDER
jgi:hypothetical protein